MSDDAIRMLEFRFEDEETGFGVMPGWDEVIEIPPEFEPPRLENDDSRPQYLSHPYATGFGKTGFNKTQGRTAPQVQELLSRLGLAPNALKSTQTIWSDWGLKGSEDGNDGIFVGMIENETREEVAPGMAGAQRSPTPPSPQLRRRKRSPSPSPTPSTPSTSTSSSRSHASAYPDSPPPATAATTTDDARSTRRTRRRIATSPGSRASSASEEEDAAEGGSMMTEPLNDGHDATEEEGASARSGGGGQGRWTRRRRRNTGTRMNPLQGSSYVADEE
ncbi:hypothetical protein QFC21_005063 [Naganishia friedmannii]|uniref:Uncharacterized protein n=1 Tax=Naganishia friedmannii TaxID=89922 RepID=A0ACC2VCX3_9TREE|nr:hypothetical protein QFC21_005063 [Naganishia friedmannii]